MPSASSRIIPLDSGWRFNLKLMNFEKKFSKGVKFCIVIYFMGVLPNLLEKIHFRIS
jgi:hypothetical protein